MRSVKKHLNNLSIADKDDLINLLAPSLGVKDDLHDIGNDMKDESTEMKSMYSFFTHKMDRTLSISDICSEFGISENDYNTFLNQNKESWENEYYNHFARDILREAFLIANRHPEEWNYAYLNVDINKFKIREVK